MNLKLASSQFKWIDGRFRVDGFGRCDGHCRGTMFGFSFVIGADPLLFVLRCNLYERSILRSEVLLIVRDVCV